MLGQAMLYGATQDSAVEALSLVHAPHVQQQVVETEQLKWRIGHMSARPLVAILGRRRGAGHRSNADRSRSVGRDLRDVHNAPTEITVTVAVEEIDDQA